MAVRYAANKNRTILLRWFSLIVFIRKSLLYTTAGFYNKQNYKQKLRTKKNNITNFCLSLLSVDRVADDNYHVFHYGQLLAEQQEPRQNNNIILL